MQKMLYTASAILDNDPHSKRRPSSAMVTQVLNLIFGSKNDREIKALRPIVEQINGLESGLTPLSDQALADKTQEFKKRLEAGQTLDDILPEAFAVCREMSRRKLNMRHFDVQLIGGMILHRGRIAEMKTGEGKTLVATLPIYLNALGRERRPSRHRQRLSCQAGRSMDGAALPRAGPLHRDHSARCVIYLSTRPMMRPINGCNTFALAPGLKPIGADITYGTNNEYGFDYLRDNLVVNDLSQCVQRELNFAIVDEVDSILIDEARTPLIISGPTDQTTDLYYRINAIIPQLKAETDYTIEEKTKTASLTEDGNVRVEKLLGVDNLYDPASHGPGPSRGESLASLYALQTRRGLCREGRRGHHRRRIYRTLDAGPPLERRAAPSRRGQRGREDRQ